MTTSPLLAWEGTDRQYAEWDATRGQVFKRKIIVWEDKAKTKRMQLAGLFIRLVIDGYITLSEGHGLNVTPGTGEVLVTLTPEQTASAPDEQPHFFLEVEEDEEEKASPLYGIITFSNP